MIPKNKKNTPVITHSFKSPGRINIIGEHTDYNQGLVLPTNISVYTSVEIKPRNDNIIKVTSKSFENTLSFSINECSMLNPSEWINYIKGVVGELIAAGATLKGAELIIKSDIPIGAGLSSSAALEVATALALLSTTKKKLKKTEIAKICYKAERNYAGVNCGIMDQQSIACGKEGYAMLLDCRSMEMKFIPIPKNLSFIVIDTGVKHKLTESEYNDRPRECQKILKLLRVKNKSIKTLRDVPLIFIKKQKQYLGDTSFRRAKHVITEIERTKKAASALLQKNGKLLGSLISESHLSLKNDFEVSCPELDKVVNILNSCNGVLGSRMIGAGFGGSVISLVENKKTTEIIKETKKRFYENFGKIPWIKKVETAPAAGLISN